MMALPSKRSVMNIHATVSCDGCHVLVTSAGQTYDNALIRAVILRNLTHLCYRMGTLDSADDSLGSCQIFKSIHCFIIRDGHILCSADVMQVCMFRSDSRIVLQKWNIRERSVRSHPGRNRISCRGRFLRIPSQS